MKKVIYIRHGSDRRTNHKYDEELTEEGKLAARDLAEKLINEYGLPDIIYYSPFYRTRQTKKEMIKIIKQHNFSKKTKIKLDPRLGRFFDKKGRRNPDIKTSTQKKGAIIDQSMEDFKERIQEQYEDAISKPYPVIWNITHTLVLLRIAKITNTERSKYVEYLDYCVIEK